MKTKTQGSTINELCKRYKTPNPYRWIVDGLLRNNRPRPSLLCGYPHAGKSTLSRQLAIAVNQGYEFLGHSTKKGRVLYWQCEESDEDISQEFIKQGVDPQTKDIVIYKTLFDDFQGHIDELIIELNE